MYNDVLIVGFLTRHDQSRLEQRGDRRYLRVSVTTKRVWVDLDGVQKSEPVHHSVEAWGHTADLLNQIPSGERVLVQGWYKCWELKRQETHSGVVTEGPYKGARVQVAVELERFHATLVAQLVLRTDRPGGLSRRDTQALEAAVLELSDSEAAIVARALGTRAARLQRQAAQGR